jgi:hypothetical protein
MNLSVQNICAMQFFIVLTYSQNNTLKKVNHLKEKSENPLKE